MVFNNKEKIKELSKTDKEKIKFLLNILKSLPDMGINVNELANEAIKRKEVNFKKWNVDELYRLEAILSEIIKKF